MKGFQAGSQMPILQAPHSWELSIILVCSLLGLACRGHSVWTTTLLASGPHRCRSARLWAGSRHLVDLAAKCQHMVCVKQRSPGRAAHGMTPNKEDMPYFDFRKQYSLKWGVVLITDIKLWLPLAWAEEIFRGRGVWLEGWDSLGQEKEERVYGILSSSKPLNEIIWKQPGG